MSFNLKIKEEIFEYLLKEKQSRDILAYFFLLKHFREEDKKVFVLKKSRIDFLNSFIEKYLVSINISYWIKDDNLYFDKQNAELIERFKSKMKTQIKMNKKKNSSFILSSQFLLSGYINNPVSKYYHFEIRANSTWEKNVLKKIFDEINIEPKERYKNNAHYLYIKRSSWISDILKFMNAQQAVFSFEDQRIERDFVSQLKKMESISEYNNNKIQSASSEQKVSIEYLIEKNLMKSFNQKKQNLAYMRLKKLNLSLEDLAFEYNKKYNQNFSKSTINHWLREFNTKYNSLVGNGKKNKIEIKKI